MTFLALIYTASIAIVIALFFANALRMRGPWGSFWTFSLIIFLAVLAAELWVRPVGPSYQGIYWIPPFAVGVLVASILAASTSSSAFHVKQKSKPGESIEQKANAIALGKFFWFVVLFMFVLVVMGLFAGS